MPKMTAVALTAILLAGIAGAQTGAGHTVEKTFTSGGTIQFHLSPADYKIEPTSGDRIVVRWEGRNADEANATVDVSGSTAMITTHTPHNNGPDFTIQVPAKANLRIHLSVGDMTIDRVEGDLDAEVGVGDLHVNVGDPERYASVEASTKIGDLNAGPFHVTQSGWLGHSFTWTGNGKYRMRAHVGTGDLVLSGSTTTI